MYPDGIHGAIQQFLENEGIQTGTATLDEEEHGLSQEVLDNTDVLIWWGHIAHDEVSDEVVERVRQRVLNGMGLVVLHSGHFSKIFKKLMGTSCDLKWREADEKERLWVVDPSHPIAANIGQYIELPKEEMYGEHFDIPTPDELVFVSWFEGGKYSAAAAHTSAAKVKSFISARGMKPIRPIIIKKFSRLLSMPFSGQSLQRVKSQSTEMPSRLKLLAQSNLHKE